MADTRNEPSFSTLRWVIGPVLITLAVTVLRVVGELNHWDPTFFSDKSGGGGAVVGISWLVPIFGIYFARKLAGIGLTPAKPGKTIGLYALIAALMAGVGFVLFGLLKLKGMPAFGTFSAACLVAVALAYFVWPALGRLLLAYGVGARIPVVVVALIAIQNDWQTHYDRAPDDLPAMSTWTRFFLTGMVPQLTLWIAFTVILGGLFGTAAAALSRSASLSRRRIARDVPS